MENRYSRVNDKLFFADTNTELIDLPLSCFNKERELVLRKMINTPRRKRKRYRDCCID